MRINYYYGFTIIISMLLFFVTYYSIKVNVVEKKFDSFVVLLQNKKAGAHNLERIYEPSFFVAPDGGYVDFYALTKVEGQWESTIKNVVYKDFIHYEYPNVERFIKKDENTGKYVFRVLYHTKVEGAQVVFFIQEDFWHVLYENFISIVYPFIITGVLLWISRALTRRDILEKFQNYKLEDIISLVDSSCIIIETDENKKITRVNQKGLYTSQFSQGELYGESHRKLSGYRIEQKDWAKAYDKIFNEGAIWNETIKNVTKKGDYYFLDAHIKKKTNEQGAISLGYDITELIEKQIEIERKNKLLSHIAYSIRHDMKNSIMVYLAVAIKTIVKKYPEDTMMLDRVFHHLKKQYSGIHEFSNLIKPNPSFNTEIVDVGKTLNNFFKNTAYQSRVEVNLSLKLDISENMFSQAIDNLVRNGIKYNDSKNKKVIIFEEPGHIIVSDNGRGMSQTQFEDYSKDWIRGGQKESGSGLGLTITKEILKVHGMEITALKMDKGTKIIIKHNQ